MKNKKIWIASGVLLIVAAAAFYFFVISTSEKKPDGGHGRGTGQALPVMAAAARNGDIEVTINALENAASIILTSVGLNTRPYFS